MVTWRDETIWDVNIKTDLDGRDGGDVKWLECFKTESSTGIGVGGTETSESVETG